MQGTILGIIAVGLFFSFIFQIGTHEPYASPEERASQYSEGRKIKWYLWFAEPRFYAVSITNSTSHVVWQKLTYLFRWLLSIRVPD